MTQSVGSALPPKAARSPAAEDASAEGKVIGASEQIRGIPSCVSLADRLALRPAEAARALGIGERTLRKWMRELDLPYARLDGVVLIPRAGLEIHGGLAV